MDTCFANLCLINQVTQLLETSESEHVVHQEVIIQEENRPHAHRRFIHITQQAQRKSRLGNSTFTDVSPPLIEDVSLNSTLVGVAGFVLPPHNQ